MSDDERLIARAAGGDRAAFGELVRRHQRRVYAAALHITGNHSDADDVAQESFVKAFRHLAGFDGRADLFTWLYRITINTALNHLRSRKRIDRLVRSAEAGADGGPEPADATQRTPREWVEISDRLRQVIEQVCELSPVLRVTLVLATVEGLPYKKIAELLEVPEGTVAWRVNEARRQLRDRVAEDEGELVDPADVEEIA
jgi:RNA polymerase sigma-70 factor, ECF subfamily